MSVGCYTDKEKQEQRKEKQIDTKCTSVWRWTENTSTQVAMLLLGPSPPLKGDGDEGVLGVKQHCIEAFLSVYFSTVVYGKP